MPRTRVLVTALVACACGPRLEEQTIGHLRHLSGEVRTHRDGDRMVPFDVLPGETSLAATVQPTSASALTHVPSFDAPDDTRLFDAVEEVSSTTSRSNAGYLGPAATLSWPQVPGDRALAEGQWRLGVAAATDDGTYLREPVQVDILLKSDPDPTSGTLAVAIVYAGSTADDAGLVQATQDAVAYWRELYDRIGITLDVVETSYPEGALEAPGAGSGQHYEAIAEQTGLGVVNVVIAESIPGVDDVYGIAGDIPAPLVPSPRTAVIVSVEDARGPDGRFSDTEQRIYGETLAHEVGHLVGLFHPVESTYDSYDGLEDTPDCPGERACISKLADNLMFPFPVCSILGCMAQTELTDDQGTVANLYPAVD